MECSKASRPFFSPPTTVGSRQVIVPRMPTRLCRAAQQAKERSVSGRESLGQYAEHHVCCPHGVRHRPRASVLVGGQHDEDALRKKQMPLVQNKVTLSRTILGRPMTPCKRSHSHDIFPPARCVNLQFGQVRALCSLSTPPALNAFSFVVKLRAHGPKISLPCPLATPGHVCPNVDPFQPPGSLTHGRPSFGVSPARSALDQPLSPAQLVANTD